MKTIVVYTQDIIPNTQYICDAEGRCDLLGQILVNGFNIRIPPKTRTPQCLSGAINHFVVCIRRYVYSNTQLTQQLLSLTTLSPRKQVAEANKLLKPIGIELVIDGEVSKKKEVEVEELVNRLSFTSLFRTSRYSCECGNSQVLSNLILDNEDDEVIMYCNYCNDELPSELSKRIHSAFPNEVRR